MVSPIPPLPYPSLPREGLDRKMAIWQESFPNAAPTNLLPDDSSSSPPPPVWIVS